MSSTFEDAPAENPASEESTKVSPVKGGDSEGVASCDQTTNTVSPSPCQIEEYTLSESCPTIEYTLPDSSSVTLPYAEDLQVIDDVSTDSPEVLVPAETGKEAAAEQEGESTDDQANGTTDKPKEWGISGEDSKVENKGEAEERNKNFKEIWRDAVSTEGGNDGDQQNQEVKDIEVKDIPVEDDNKQHTEVENQGAEPQNCNFEDKLPDESVVPVVTMSTQESQEPVTTVSTQESQEPVTTVSTPESQEPVTTESTQESQEPVTTMSTQNSQEPLTTISTQESQEPDTMEKVGPEPEEQTPAEQPNKTKDDVTDGECKLEQEPKYGSVLVTDGTVEKADQRGEQTKEEEEKKEEESKKEVKNENENKDDKDKQDEVLESTLQNQTAEKEAFDKLLDENVKLKMENERLKSEHADISHKYTTFNQEKEQMLKVQAEQEKEIKGLHNEVEDLRKGLDVDVKVQELQKKLMQLTKEYEDKDKRIHTLLSELDSTKGKLREAESKLERNGTAKQEVPTSKTCAIM